MASASDPASMAVEPAAGARVAALGISIDDPCGVRDHAVLLADALAAGGTQCTLHWLWRTAGSIGAERGELRAWTEELARELSQERPEAILLHYSVFAYSHRGVPMFVRPLLSAIAALDIPLVTFMHEYAYPWSLGGARGKVWALSQRVALAQVVRSSSALVVSAQARADWLGTRTWLPRRPVSVAPVFSNLPDSSVQPRDAAVARLGLFGYGHEGAAVTTVLDALEGLRARGSELELVLLGAPGSPSPAATRWIDEAAQRGLADVLSFSGRLPARSLSDMLAGCDVLLFAERGGPTSRKTTLAASLSSGRPVVALDGHNTWTELVQARAALVEPDSRALAQAIAGLLDDRDAREQQGMLGSAFARRTMSAEHSAQVIGDALRCAIGGARR